MKIFLDRLLKKYHRTEFLWSDPLEFVHRFKDPWDQEAVAVFSALLAYGNVRQIRRSVEDLLKRMGGCPAEFVRCSSTPDARAALRGFVHRFNVGEDVTVLARLIAASWEKYGSVGAHFLTHLDPDASDISTALNQLMNDWRSQVRGAKPSFYYFLTAPEDGSCCKRWCMLLRWMGRKDAVDPGLWTEGSALASTFPRGRSLRASQLILPLDTHTGRISQYLGLTQRRSLGWKAALEVTESLRNFDPDDPSKYDFALARLGILDLCQRKYRKEICTACELVSACRFAKAASVVR